VNGGSTPTTIALAGEVAAAKAAVAAQPNSYAERLRYARDLLQVQNYPEAIKQYTAASRVDPTQAEPLAYSGWISAVVSESVNDANLKKALLDGASSRINAAISVDPTYPDAYVFKGLLLSQLLNKPCDAVPAFQRYLVLAPQNNPMRNQVLDALSNAIQAGKCPTPNTVRP
jgi:tetratricopeptide (TPR) repeat protein